MLFLPSNINDDFNFFNMNDVESFYSFYNKNKEDEENNDYISNLLSKDFNIKFLYKLNKSKNLFFSINKFFDFNLIDFYNYRNRLESYKNVMAINSVYEYRFSNSSFKTIEEFILTIFKTPLDYLIYFDDLYKNLNYNIVSNIYKKVENNFFFKDIYNINSKRTYKYYLNFLRFFSRLFKMRVYFFKFDYL
jgi:hypothetical protein